MLGSYAAGNVSFSLLSWNGVTKWFSQIEFERAIQMFYNLHTAYLLVVEQAKPEQHRSRRKVRERPRLGEHIIASKDFELESQ